MAIVPPTSNGLTSNDIAAIVSKSSPTGSSNESAQIHEQMSHIGDVNTGDKQRSMGNDYTFYKQDTNNFKFASNKYILFEDPTYIVFDMMIDNETSPLFGNLSYSASNFFTEISKCGWYVR